MTDESTPADPFAPPPKPGMDRRTFVKTAVAAAAVGAVGATGAGLVVPLSTAGGLRIRRFPYVGARKAAGPAPQGIPLIPLQVNADGEIEGVPKLEGANVEHSLEWYRYCSHEATPGLELGFTDDNVLRYFNNPAKVRVAEQELGAPLWYAPLLDQRVRADHFTQVGHGAPFRWRSEGQVDTNIITGIVIRVDPTELQGRDVTPFLATHEDKTFIAFCSFCAHFCCVPGYQESKIPREKGLFDKIYCTCHDTVYDPRDLRQYTFPPNM
jgi:Rieske Fe-S protein